MKVCVFGAGAIGGHLAARFAKGGAEVSLVARGAHLEAIRRDGLTVCTPTGDLNCRVPASADPAALGPQDAVVVTVKAPALPEVARTIAPLLKPETPVVFVMNGIPWWYFHASGGPLDGRRLPLLDPGDALWKAVGPRRAIGGVVNSPSSVVAPGVVNVEREANWVTFGEPDNSVSRRVETLVAIVREGGIEARASTDIRTAIWNKLISNLMTGPMAVLTQSSYKDFLAEPACFAAARRVVEEATAVALALGCKPDKDPEPRLAQAVKLAHRASILQDLELGRPMEVDSIFGMAVEMARLAGVATPTLDLLVGLSRARARSAGLYGG
jgi:2-dehydropantoate 2-reductase